MPQFSRKCSSYLLSVLAALIFAQLNIATGEGAWAKTPEAARGAVAVPERDCTTADQLAVEAERLRSEWKIEALHEAVKRYEAAAKCWQSSGEASKEADALKNLGEIYSILSDYPKARDSYEKAVQLNRTKNDQARLFEALNGLSLVCIYTDKLDKAQEHGNEALSLSQRLGNVRGEASALNNLGFAQYFRGDLKGALDTFNKALPLARGLDDQLLLGSVLLNIGYTYNDAGDLEQALSSYQQALPFWQAAQYLRGVSRTLTAIGGVDIALGRIQDALDRHRQALKIAEDMGDVDGQGIIRNSIGYVYEIVGDDERALDLYLQALDHFTASGNLGGQAQTSQFVGKVYKRLGNNAKAKEYYLRALSLSGQDRLLEALALNSLGTISEANGETGESLRNFNRALSIYRAAGNRRGEIVTLNNLGHLNVTKGAKPAALSFYAQSLPLALATGDRALEVVTRGRIAQLQRDMGRLDEARSQLEASLKAIETIRTKVISPELRTSYLASTRDHYEVYVDVLMQLNKQRPGQGLDAAALRTSELARARNLLDMLVESHADIRQGIASELLEQERLVQLNLDKLAERQVQLLAAEHTPAQTDSLEKEIRILGTQYEELETKIRQQSPRYAALMRPQPIGLEEIQGQVLDDQTLLLEYAMGDERSYLWAVTRDQVTSYELPGRAGIEEAARNVYALLTANQPIPGESFEQRQTRAANANEQLPSQTTNLSKILLGPVADRLGTKRLLIVPDGALQYIPFQILNTGNARRPLVADHEIVNEPSASALALLVNETKNRKPAPNSVAVLADPVFESDDPRITYAGKSAATSRTEQVQETEIHQALRDVNLSGEGHIPRLLASRYEADAIMSVTPWRSGFEAMGFDASRATVTKTDLSNYRIVHFATHGLLNSEHPELSGIVLSLFDQKGQPQDGFLRLRDIYNLNLPVDLVVLSACDTGLGKDVKGEGLIGLTRGFMYAGASSVVASLWKVDDEATAELMRLFYGYMLRDGLSPAAALRKAQVTMSQQKRWQSPYYWAGFVIQGQYIPTARVNRFPILRLALWLIAAILVSATAFYAVRRRRKIVL